MAAPKRKMRGRGAMTRRNRSYVFTILLVAAFVAAVLLLPAEAITGTLRTVDKERGIVAVWSAQGQRPNGSSCEMIFHRDINAVTPLKKEGN